MEKPGSQSLGYLLAASLGALGGGILVVYSTRAIPKMMSRMVEQMMPNMMKNMQQKMKDGGCSPDT